MFLFILYMNFAEELNAKLYFSTLWQQVKLIENTHIHQQHFGNTLNS